MIWPESMKKARKYPTTNGAYFSVSAFELFVEVHRKVGGEVGGWGLVIFISFWFNAAHVFFVFLYLIYFTTAVSANIVSKSIQAVIGTKIVVVFL